MTTRILGLSGDDGTLLAAVQRVLPHMAPGFRFHRAGFLDPVRDYLIAMLDVAPAVAYGTSDQHCNVQCGIAYVRDAMLAIEHAFTSVDPSAFTRKVFQRIDAYGSHGNLFAVIPDVTTRAQVEAIRNRGGLTVATRVLRYDADWHEDCLIDDDLPSAERSLHAIRYLRGRGWLTI